MYMYEFWCMIYDEKCDVKDIDVCALCEIIYSMILMYVSCMSCVMWDNL